MNDNIYGDLNLVRYNLLKFRKFEDICETLNLSRDELMECINLINKYDNNNISIKKREEELKIDYKSKEYQIHMLNNVKQKLKLMFVSDKHIDHVDDRIGYINDVYEEAERRGVDYIFDLGDILNGPAEKIHKPNKVRTGTLEGSISQLIDLHPNNIPTHFITGNHDIKFMDSNRCNIGKLIEKECGNFKFLGDLFTSININGLIINLTHGNIENKLISQVHLNKEFPFLTQNNPHIIMQGHFHKKHDPILFKNRILCQVPCLKASSTDNMFPVDSKDMGAIYLTVYDLSKYFEVQYESMEFIETKKVLKKEINIQKTKIDI